MPNIWSVAKQLRKPDFGRLGKTPVRIDPRPPKVPQRRLLHRALRYPALDIRNERAPPP
jgi:hypothetical protein